MQTHHNATMLESQRAQKKATDDMQSRHKAAMHALRQQLKDADQRCKDVQLEAETQSSKQERTMETIKLHQRLAEARQHSANHSRTQALGQELEECKADVVQFKSREEKMRSMRLKNLDLHLLSQHQAMALCCRIN